MYPIMPSLAAILPKSFASASNLSLSFAHSLLICGLLASYQPFLSRLHRANYGNDTATTRQRHGNESRERPAKEQRRDTKDAPTCHGRFETNHEVFNGFQHSSSNLVFGNIKYLNNICQYLLNKKVFVYFCQVLLSVFV